MATAKANVEPKSRPAQQQDDAGDQAVTALSKEQIPGAVEAILLTADRPLSPGKVAEALSLEPGLGSRQVRETIDQLNEQYEKTDRSFRIENVAGGYRIMTRSEFAPAIAAIKGVRDRQRLSRAAIETLAIVAYKQPITRAKIEAIRGVASGEVLRGLLERRLITITGRAEELGRPMLYGTSKLFLETFGLSSPSDLPPIDEMVVRAAEAEAESEASGESEESGDPSKEEV